MDLVAFQDLDVVLICGLPGSGKSHFAGTYFKDSDRKRINRKEIRRLLYEMMNFGAPWREELFSEKDEFLVKHVERKIIEHLLQDRGSALIDNTSISSSSRRNYINIARQMKRNIGVIFLNIPLLTCIERNRSRADHVPDRVISNLSAAIDLPENNEGFKQILIVDHY